MSETITIIVALVGVFSMFGKSLDRYNISPPMVFISIGILTGSFLRQVPATDNSTNMEIVLLVAELTLIVVLFHDASTVQIRDLYVSFPTRMLAIGLPMTLILLYYTTAALMPFLGLHGALLIAAALTPTDAGLGAPTILNPAVPSRVRQALNVESGINDGLITPIVLIAIEGLARSAGNSGTPDIPSVALVPISIAIGLAAGIAPVYAMVLDHSAEQKWSTFSGRSIAIVMLPLLMWGLSIATGANSFIAAFLAGGFFGYFSKSLHSDHALPELLEAVADFLSYCAWFFAGG
ncbi:Cation/H+ exchanger [Ochromonadaceae sp. CCMP2298]|nr:Cation/H+ exchanger [Ochromonadaceae sp. CCMP2298]